MPYLTRAVEAGAQDAQLRIHFLANCNFHKLSEKKRILKIGQKLTWIRVKNVNCAPTFESFYRPCLKTSQVALVVVSVSMSAIFEVSKYGSIAPRFQWYHRVKAIDINFFSNFGHLFGPFNLVFYSHCKNIHFFEIKPKLMFLGYFFYGAIFFAEEFLLSQKIGIKLWIDCEKNSDVIWYCESQCKQNSAHIVTHIVRRLWAEMNTFIIRTKILPEIQILKKTSPPLALVVVSVSVSAIFGASKQGSSYRVYEDIIM